MTNIQRGDGSRSVSCWPVLVLSLHCGENSAIAICCSFPPRQHEVIYSVYLCLARWLTANSLLHSHCSSRTVTAVPKCKPKHVICLHAAVYRFSYLLYVRGTIFQDNGYVTLEKCVHITHTHHQYDWNCGQLKKTHRNRNMKSLNNSHNDILIVLY